MKTKTLVHKAEPTAAIIVSAASRTGSSKSSKGPMRLTSHIRTSKSSDTLRPEVSVNALVRVVQMKKSVRAEYIRELRLASVTALIKLAKRDIRSIYHNSDNLKHRMWLRAFCR